MGNVGKTAFIFSMQFVCLFYEEMYTASLLVSHWYVIYSLFLCFFISTSSMFIHVSVHHLLRDVTHNSNNFPLLSLSSTFSAGQNVSFTPTYWLSFLFSRHFRITFVTLFLLFSCVSLTSVFTTMSFFRSICDVNLCLASMCVLLYS